MKNIHLKWISTAFWVLATLIIALCSPITAQENAPFPAASPESQNVPAESLENLKKIVRDYVATDQIVGAELLVIKNRRTILHEAFGWCDREDSLVMTPNTIFNIRSMTKPLTGAAVQILIDEGKLNLTDRAAEYLPGFENDESGEITVEQLLTHHSGLPLTILSGFDEYDDLVAMANAVGQRGPDFEPGSKLWYSDAGTDALGAIVEVVAGVPLDEFLTKRLFEPLGMKNTFHLTKKTNEDNRQAACLYGGTTGQWTRFWGPGDDPFYPFPWGSQTVYSSPADYASFLAMWLDGGVAGGRRILSPEAIERTLTPVAIMKGPGSDTEYPTAFPHLRIFHGQMALVYMDPDNPGGRPKLIGYGGSDGTFAWAWPGLDLIVAYFTQSRGQATMPPFEKEIYRLLINPGYAYETADVSKQYRAFVGKYMTQTGPLANTMFEVLIQNGNLAVDVPGQMVYELREPNVDGRRPFKLTDLVAVSFNVGDSGAVLDMLMHQTTQLPRKKPAEAMADNAPEQYRPLLGSYAIPMANQELAVAFISGQLAVIGPDGAPRVLVATGSGECWIFEDNEHKAITFGTGEDGLVTALNVTDSFVLPRLNAQSTGQ